MTWTLSSSGQNKDGEMSGSQTGSSESSTAAAAAGSSQSLPSFWIPSLTPEAKPTLLKKPVSLILLQKTGTTSLCHII